MSHWKPRISQTLENCEPKRGLNMSRVTHDQFTSLFRHARTVSRRSLKSKRPFWNASLPVSNATRSTSTFSLGTCTTCKSVFQVGEAADNFRTQVSECAD